MMLIEAKTNGAEPSQAQRDTLLIYNAVIATVPFRNQRVHGPDGRFVPQHEHNVRRVHSPINGNIELVHYGVHLLQLSGTSPEDSTRIRWDRKVVSPETLVKIIRMDLDPRTLGPIDLRRHKRQVQIPLLDFHR